MQKDTLIFLTSCHLIIIAEHSSTKKMDYHWENCIIRSNLNKAFANLNNHNLFLLFSDEINQITRLEIFPDFPKKSITSSGSLEFHEISKFFRFPGRVTTLNDELD